MKVIKRIAKNLVQNIESTKFYTRYTRPVVAIFRSYGAWNGLYYIYTLFYYHLLFIKKKRYLRLIGVEALKERKKSNTVFIFGSGSSLNEISESEWDLIRRNDSISLNYFPYQNWIEPTIHYVREVDVPEQVQEGKFSLLANLEAVRKLSSIIYKGNLYDNTCFFIQEDFLGLVSKIFVVHNFLKNGAQVCLFKDKRDADAVHSIPSKIEDGVSRKAGAIGGGISIANIVGWTKIVLVGVDLYDSRYFWLKPGEMRDADKLDRRKRITSPEDEHLANTYGIVEIMEEWRDELRKNGVQLEVYNPRSKLARVLPIFTWDNGIATHANPNQQQPSANIQR